MSLLKKKYHNFRIKQIRLVYGR